ncbi:MAG: iron-regulated protein [Draconibacterium sp.]|nr:iron-regulated protein [Draconibacterium sp.]
MKKIQLLFVLAFFVLAAFKSDKPAYLLYNKEGKTVKYEKMLKEIQDADIVLFGEYHNNPISHWLQLEVTKSLFEIKGEKLVLGAEMFESDNQVILTEYLDSMISQKSFEAEARLWPNYKTDYKPLVEFANKNRLNFVASNVPRRYASLVNSKGFEGLEELSDEAKLFIPPLPIHYDAELECYKSMLEMAGMGSHVTENFPKAQALKDATMAHFILKNWSAGQLSLHYHGAYHSANFESIYWHLKQLNPNLNIVTITTVSQDDVTELSEENTGTADYAICVDENMTSTR